MARTSKVTTEFNKGHVAVCDNCLKAEFISEADGIRIPPGWLEIGIKQESSGSIVTGDLCSISCITDIVGKGVSHGPSA